MSLVHVYVREDGTREDGTSASNASVSSSFGLLTCFLFTGVQHSNKYKWLWFKVVSETAGSVNFSPDSMELMAVNVRTHSRIFFGSQRDEFSDSG